VKSFDPALPLESKMLGLRQSSEFTRGALDGKVEAAIGPNEVHGLAVEEADAPLHRPLVEAIRLCHLLLSHLPFH